MPRRSGRAVWVVGMILAAGVGRAQNLPQTAGETLIGKPMVVAEAVKGRPAVLVAGFSREASEGIREWLKMLWTDPGLTRVQVLELANLERAPGFVRGAIKRAMRKGMTAADQDRVVVMTADEKAWRSFFGVDNDREPWVVALDGAGRVVWHGHGRARDLEELVRAAVK